MYLRKLLSRKINDVNVPQDHPISHSIRPIQQNTIVKSLRWSVLSVPRLLKAHYHVYLCNYFRNC